jgi:hypothetical protein
MGDARLVEEPVWEMAKHQPEEQQSSSALTCNLLCDKRD